MSAIEDIGLPVAAYDAGQNVKIVACIQRDGSRKWAVKDGCGDVLNKRGAWEYEPLPSSRDEDFIARCRYDSPLEARHAYMRFLGSKA